MNEWLVYWRKRCELAEQVIEHTPCDMDITEEQIQAVSNYNDFIKNGGSFSTIELDEI